MPTLFLVDGAAGAGKSDFLKHCCEGTSDEVYIKKHTTKEKDSDGILREDLIYCSFDEYNELKAGKQANVDYFEYKYPENDTKKRYLVFKDEIDEKLRKYKNVYLIIRNIDVLKEIKRAYSQFININVITIFIYCDSIRLKERVTAQCKQQCISDNLEIEKNINKRLSRNAECLKSYINSIGEKIYDYVILNDLSYDEYHNCLENIKKCCDEKNQKFSNLYAFIIMPMVDGREAAHFNEVKKAIKKGALEQGFVAQRQDDKYDSDIVPSIKDSISKSAVCIADLTLSRPNCYYELGLADAFLSSDRVIILKQEKELLAFDIYGRNSCDYTFHNEDYTRISNIVSEQLSQFKKKHIFITDELERKMRQLIESTKI